MARDSSAEPGREEKENEFVEVDPTGRYGRVRNFSEPILLIAINLRAFFFA